MKKEGVLIIPKWDIADAIVFDAIRKETNTIHVTKEEVQQASKGVNFSKHHATLVMWKLRKRDPKIIGEDT